MDVQARLRRHWPAGAAAVLLLVSIVAAWPGAAMFDTVRQYSQVLAGSFDDWHPPVMARLWSLLHPLADGTGPLFMLQIAAYWLGLGTLAQALGGRRAAAVLVIGASPVLLGWQAVVLKDAQLVGALSCAFGLIAWFRLRARPMTGPAVAAVILCLGYATLLRANAAFSMVPLAVLLFMPPGRRFFRPAAIVAGIALAIVASQFVNRHLLGARDSGIARVEAVYDLAGIAVRSGDPIYGIDPMALTEHHCVKPLFWDPMQNREDCQLPLAGIDHMPAGTLYLMLADAAAAHPVAYATHRLAHLNATSRWLVSRNWPLAAPPAYNEPNALGLESPSCCMLLRWQETAQHVLDTPLGWPFFWIALGICGLVQLRRIPPGPRRDLALALLASALCQEASFAILSISSDLRYHLWAMLAVALAWTMLWSKWRWDRPATLCLAGLCLVLLPALAARLILPEGPVAYADLVN
ncbi:MAG: hypothetical protein J7485_10755 [Sphingobium sp.]|nr:hypothetical protein [Sphingobium sp.]